MTDILAGYDRLVRRRLITIASLAVLGRRRLLPRSR
jgi:hypothetical protein